MRVEHAAPFPHPHPRWGTLFLCTQSYLPVSTLCFTVSTQQHAVMHRLRGKRPASPASSAMPLSIPATSAQPTPTAGNSRGGEIAKTSLNIIIEALRFTKESSSACPPLQSAVGALLSALEAYKVRFLDLTPFGTRDILSPQHICPCSFISPTEVFKHG